MKPILFSTPMVQAILAGQKTMTRRVIDKGISNNFDVEIDGKPIVFIDQATGDRFKPESVARYHAGDILWVRETWRLETEQGIHTGGYIYKASDYPEQDGDAPLKWRPSIFMPKEASRLFLRVTGVRAERLQDITVEDVMSEGLPCDNKVINRYPETHESIRNWNLTYAQFLFHELWDKLNAKRGYGWDTNPWVWVYTFERITREEAQA